MYNAMIMAPIVSVWIWPVLGFFMILGLMAQDRPRRTQIVTDKNNNISISDKVDAYVKFKEGGWR